MQSTRPTRREAGSRLLLLACVLVGSCRSSNTFGQPAPAPLIPKPVTPKERPLPPVSPPEVEEYWKLPKTGSFDERLTAYRRFVDRYPGTQLALKVMREVASFYIVRDQSQSNNPLEECATWLRERLDAPEYGWERYAEAPLDQLQDRVETHLLYARILASLGRFDRALEVLRDLSSQAERRPDLDRQRGDLIEQAEFTRCWCMHGWALKKASAVDIESVLLNYERFIDRFPSSDYVPSALGNAIKCLQQLDFVDRDDRIQAYRRRLFEEFPGSPETVELQVLLESNG